MISNVSIFGILAIVTAVIGSIFLFGLDDEIIKGVEYQNVVSSQSSSIIFAQQDKTEKTTNLESKDKEQNIIADKKLIDERLKDTSSNIQDNIMYQKKQNSNLSALEYTTNLDKKIKEFEKKIFTLKGIGTYYQGTIQNSKTSSINITLKPIPNTHLNNFEIISGIMELGLGFTADNGQVVINDDKIIITLNRNDHHDVSGILSGSFVGSILNDNKNEHSIHFENQAISIGEDVHSPLHLTSDAILSF